MRRAPLGRPGFSLVEILFVILMIFLLMGLLLGAVHFVTKQARGAADAATVNSLKQAVSKFNQEFSFPPPLVKDGYVPAFTPAGPLNPAGPPATLTQVPVVYSAGVLGEQRFLRFADPTSTNGPPPAFGAADLRFSLYSLSYYVLGVLDSDGLPGPGFRTPKRNGSFEKAGRTFSPFFDFKGNAQAVVESTPGTGRFELRDSHGVAFRYYRWTPGREYPSGSGNYEVRTVADLNVPWMVGDPNTNPELKNANYAIVAAGPNGLFGDEIALKAAAPTHPQAMIQSDFELKLGVPSNLAMTDLITKAMSDNIVVVGVEVNR